MGAGLYERQWRRDGHGGGARRGSSTPLVFVCMSDIRIGNDVPFEELQSADLVLDRTYRGGTSGSVADDPLNRLIPVGNAGGFRYKGGAEAPLLIALYTTGAEDDWPDSLDPSTSTFTYYGDNRKPGRDLFDTPRHGNEILRRTFARAHGDPEARAQVAPHLLFAKGGRGRDIVFRGLLAPGATGLTADEDLLVISQDRQGLELRNYQAKFTVLDAERVTRAWLTTCSLVNRSPTTARMPGGSGSSAASFSRSFLVRAGSGFRRPQFSGFRKTQKSLPLGTSLMPRPRTTLQSTTRMPAGACSGKSSPVKDSRTSGKASSAPTGGSVL